MTQKEYIKRLEEQIEAQKKVTYLIIQQITEEYNKCCSKYGALPCKPQVIGTALKHNPHWINLKKSKLMKNLATFVKHIMYD